MRVYATLLEVFGSRLAPASTFVNESGVKVEVVERRMVDCRYEERKTLKNGRVSTSIREDELRTDVEIAPGTNIEVEVEVTLSGKNLRYSVLNLKGKTAPPKKTL